MNQSWMKLACFTLSLLAIAGDSEVKRLDHPPTEADLKLPLIVWSEITTEPEPLAIFLARIDLQYPGLRVIAMPADDPDGDGPAEAALTAPETIAGQQQAILAINANGFGAPPGQSDEHWRTGLPVDIAGLAVHRGVVLSPPNAQGANRCSFWLDTERRPHIGTPEELANVQEAVTIFYIDLVEDGKILPSPGGKRHPRTALGLDATRRWLTLAIVDGRRAGHSVGMTGHELATLMQRLGCDRAFNLDGGGSSILLAATAEGKLETVNRPSGFFTRPLPLMLGVIAVPAQAD